MPQDQKHRSFLQFIRRVIDVPAGLSKDDLLTFRSLASHQYVALTPLIDAYLQLAEKADSDVMPRDAKARSAFLRKGDPGQMHLFDLLRERRLFPSNSDLSEFAGRVLPNMSRHRFDKMSRGDIAARVIEYLETRDQRTRESLEASMRDAMVSGSSKSSDRKSFLSKWERIIKGIEL